jgi:ribonuclease P protein component
MGGGMRRAQRLRQRREFAAVYRHGRPYRTGRLVLRAIENGRPLSRFGFTASRAVGKAVVRNKVKRRMREAARALPVRAGWDIVVNARRSAAGAGYHQLRADLAELLGRAGLGTEEKDHSR